MQILQVQNKALTKRHPLNFSTFIHQTTKERNQLLRFQQFLPVEIAGKILLVLGFFVHTTEVLQGKR